MKQIILFVFVHVFVINVIKGNAIVNICYEIKDKYW